MITAHPVGRLIAPARSGFICWHWHRYRRPNDANGDIQSLDSGKGAPNCLKWVAWNGSKSFSSSASKTLKEIQWVFVENTSSIRDICTTKYILQCILDLIIWTKIVNCTIWENQQYNKFIRFAHSKWRYITNKNFPQCNYAVFSLWFLFRFSVTLQAK